MSPTPDPASTPPFPVSHMWARYCCSLSSPWQAQHSSDQAILWLSSNHWSREEEERNTGGGQNEPCGAVKAETSALPLKIVALTFNNGGNGHSYRLWEFRGPWGLRFSITLIQMTPLEVSESHQDPNRGVADLPGLKIQSAMELHYPYN